MASYSYSGNNDFRGYLAANYKPLLAFTGNDGGVDWNKLNKAGGVDLPTASYDTGATAKLVSNLYSKWQNLYKTDLAGAASAADRRTEQALAALAAQPVLPKFNYAANYAKAQQQAAKAVNPVYKDKLNAYLEKANVALNQEKVQTTRNKEDISTALAQALDDSATSRTRTAEDTTTQLGDVNASENTFQTQEGRAFDQARTALLGDVSNAGLTESGIGQGQVANAVTDRNIASADQTRQFSAKRRDINTLSSRTLADLDTADVRSKGTAERKTGQEDIDLNNFIQNAGLEEKAFRAENEAGRVGAINTATGSAYDKIVANVISSLANSGTRSQDIALFKQVYG
jgi:hypothetical protein